MKATPFADECIRMLKDVISIEPISPHDILTDELLERYGNNREIYLKEHRKHFDNIVRNIEYKFAIVTYRLIPLINVAHRNNRDFKALNDEDKEQFLTIIKKHSNFDLNVLWSVLTKYDEVTIDDLKNEFWQNIPELNSIPEYYKMMKMKFYEIYSKLPDDRYYKFNILLKTDRFISSYNSFIKYGLVTLNEVEILALKIENLVMYIHIIIEQIVELYKSFQEFDKKNDSVILPTRNQEKRMQSKFEHINRIKTGTLTNKWVNGKAGQFIDFENTYELRFSETDENCNAYKVKDSEREKTPIIACGFVAWIICHWGGETQKVFENYLNAKLNQYRAYHKNAPDVIKRDLEKEFFQKYWSDEEKWIKISEEIFRYISNEEVEVLRQFVENYKEFVMKKSNPLHIDEYTKQSEIIIEADKNPKIRLAYQIFLNYPEKAEVFSLIARINDVRRVLTYHEEKPDECLNFVMNKYHTIWNIGTVFVECLKLIIDENSIFIKMLNVQPLQLHSLTQNEIKAKVDKYFTNKRDKNDVAITEIQKFNKSSEKNSEHIKNKIPTKRKIDISKLQSYFVGDFYSTRTNPINYFDKLIEELETNRNQKDFARIAFLIYSGNQMNRPKKPKTFLEWYRIFCQIIDITPNPEYGKESKMKNINEKLSSNFHFLK